MAQTIRCDYTGCEVIADVLVNNLTNGDALAWCGPHYIEGILAQADAIRAQETGATDDEAVARLEAIGAAAPNEGPEAQEAGDGGQPPIDTAEPTTAPAHLVRRGESRKAREYRKRLAARAAELAGDPTGDDAADEATFAAALESATAELGAGPDDDEDDEADEARPETAANVGSADHASAGG